VSNACQTCHKWSEEELLARAEAIRQRTVDLRNRAMDALMDLIADIEVVKAAGATEKDFAEARKAQRRVRKRQVSLRPLEWAASAAPRSPAD
jgi:nitrite reductase (cytochrome c-552)